MVPHLCAFAIWGHDCIHPHVRIPSESVFAHCYRIRLKVGGMGPRHPKKVKPPKKTHAWQTDGKAVAAVWAELGSCRLDTET
eukprot:76551-Amphidinium_carterae.2